MKKLVISVGVASMAVSLAGAALADPVVAIGTSAQFYSNGSDTVNPGDITFDERGVGPVNSVPPTTNPTPLTQNTVINNVTFTGTGAIINNPIQGNAGPGVSAAPYITGLSQNDTTNYLSVLAGSSETLAFSGDVRQVGFYWGSIDSVNGTYNQIQFY